MKLNIKHPLEDIIKDFTHKFSSFTSMRFKFLFFFVMGLLVFTSSFFVYFFGFVYPASSEFPKEELISISDGDTLSDVALLFEEIGVVNSAFWLKIIVRLLGDESSVMAGKYLFNEEENIFSVAMSIVAGELKPQYVKITIPEGSTVSDISKICNKRMESFDRKEFLSIALSEEGFLFPDTYHFPLEISEEKVFEIMNQNFNRKMKRFEEKIEESEYTLKEIITMASLLEKEAITYESKRIISGILWKRLEIGMRLQVDAVFLYINGKNTFDLTYADLAHDSPYNTYKYEGLPSGPIANPGLESIEATLNPIETEYLFYLSDMQNKMHYSETFEEHKRKKRRYLN